MFPRIILRPSTRGRNTDQTQTGEKVIDETPPPRSTLSTRKKRAKLKENVELYAEYNRLEAIRNKERRRTRTDEQKKRDRETSALRSKKYREKKRLSKLSSSASTESDTHPDILCTTNTNLSSSQTNATTLKTSTSTSSSKPEKRTRAEKQARKEYNREKQRICRAKKTPQKKAWERKKDNERKKAKNRAESKQKKQRKNLLHKEQKQDEILHSHGSPYKTDASKRSAVCRAKQSMPKSAEKYATVINSLIDSNRLTPRKKTALKQHGIGLQSKKLFVRNAAIESIKLRLADLKTKTDDDSLMKRHLLIKALLIRNKYKSALADDLGLTRTYVNQVLKTTSEPTTRTRYRKVRSDAASDELVASFHDTYRSGPVSRHLESMNSVKKDQVSRMIMETSVRKAYEIWAVQNPNRRSSLDFFRKNRPSDVLLSRRERLNQCLCEYCSNIQLKLDALNKVCTKYGMKELIINSKQDLISTTLCIHRRLSCINRTCTVCGTKKFKDKLKPLLQKGSNDISWQIWDTIKYTHDNKEKTKTVKMDRSGTILDMVNELISELGPFAKHRFVAEWQGKAFNDITKKIPRDTVVSVLDYAENFACIQQDEIQGHHWTIEQVTVHPIVNYYHCPECNDENSHIVQDAVVIISPDLKHDGHAVNEYMKQNIEHLRTTRKLTFTNMIEFTDGCGVQYKSKIPFADISFSNIDLNCSRERHYFGSRHGKLEFLVL